MYFSEQKAEQLLFYNKFHKQTKHSNTLLKHDCVMKNKNTMMYNQQTTLQFVKLLNIINKH